MKMNIHIWFNKCQLLIYMSVSKKSQNLFNCAWHNLAPNSQLSSCSLHYFAVNFFFSAKNLQENESISISTKISNLLCPSIKNHLWLFHTQFWLSCSDFSYLVLFRYQLSKQPIIYFILWKYTNFLYRNSHEIPYPPPFYFQPSSNFISVMIF